MIIVEDTLPNKSEENDSKTEDNYNDSDGDAEEVIEEQQQYEKNEIVKGENGITSEIFSVALANLRPATLFSIMIDI